MCLLLLISMVPQRRFAVPTHALRSYKGGRSETTGENTGVKYMFDFTDFSGAAKRIRTPDPRITNALLYQLSYCGVATRKGPHSTPWDPPTKDWCGLLRLRAELWAGRKSRVPSDPEAPPPLHRPIGVVAR